MHKSWLEFGARFPESSYKNALRSDETSVQVFSLDDSREYYYLRSKLAMSAI